MLVLVKGLLTTRNCMNSFQVPNSAQLWWGSRCPYLFELVQIPYRVGKSSLAGPGSLMDLCTNAILRDAHLAAEINTRKKEQQQHKVPPPLSKLDALPQELASYLCSSYICRLCHRSTSEQGSRHECCPSCSHRISTCNNESCGLGMNLWLCLSCGHVGCGRANGRHALAHHAATQHPHVVAMVSSRYSSSRKEIWCYACDSYHHHPNLDECIAALEVPEDLLRLPG